MGFKKYCIFTLQWRSSSVLERRNGLAEIKNEARAHLILSVSHTENARAARVGKISLSSRASSTMLTARAPSRPLAGGSIQTAYFRVWVDERIFLERAYRIYRRGRWCWPRAGIAHRD